MAVKALSNEELLQSNLLFQKELQHILSILIKEKSLVVIAKEILNRCVESNKGNFGIVLFNNNAKQNFIYSDPDNYITNSNEVEQGIISNFTFLSKWFEVNKKSFIAINTSDDIGASLCTILRSDSVIFSPCYFDNDLLAVMIIAKNGKPFTPLVISNLEQFATILSFSISNIKVRELNASLEARLLQSQKLETIGKLSSGMAHDFSNLLSSIFGSLNLLKKRVPQKEEITRLLDNIENCSIRAKDLTKGLLSYGKPTPKRKEKVKPNDLLKEMSKVITQTFPKSIIFNLDVNDNLYDVLGNPTEIYQVLLNLCVNAKEAIETKGALTLFAENLSITDHNIIDYPMLAIGNYVHFSVKDSGSGIAEENIQKIFDPYFSTKEKENGSGLGLYVSYGIIQAHRGIVEVSSVIGEGTTFDVYLPAYETRNNEKTGTTDKIILLVDDEIMLRDLLAELLESNSYFVITVSTSPDAIKVLTEEIKVDLIIIDYNMPGMTGLECIAKVRELNFKMPVILSTGSFNIEDKGNIEDLGISSILSKPYEFETMLSTIEELL